MIQQALLLRSAFHRAAVNLAVFALAAPALPAATNVGVDVTQTVRTVDERVFGLNAVMWDGATSTAQTISMLQAAGVRVIRIPGGSASDGYHWQRNKGDSNAKPVVLNNWTWAAGFDSFARLITGINSQAFVTVNYGSGTKQQAAAWVAYANASAGLLGTGADVTLGVDVNGFDWKTAGYWSSLRAATPLAPDDGMNFLRAGRSAPYGLKYWEIGNECYGTWEEDLALDTELVSPGPVAHDPYTYARRTKNYLTLMKQVDPTIKVGVVGDTSEDSYVNNTSHPATNPRTNAVHNGWTPVMLATLKTLGTTPDFLIYHRYEQAPGAESDAGLLQKAKTWPNDAAAIRQQLTDYLGTAGGAVELCITENNSVYTNPGKQSTSLVDALYLADSIGNVLQTEFNSLVWWDLRNGQDGTQNNSSSLYGWRPYGDYGVMSSNFFTGSTTIYDAYPTYYLLKLLQNFARGGDTVVKATSDNSLLAVFAARHHDGTLRLLVINKDPVNPITPNVTLTGLNPTDTATVYSYGIPQDTAAMQGTLAGVDVATSYAGIAGTSISSLSFAPYSATVVVIGSSVTGQKDTATYGATSFPLTAAPGATVSFAVTVTNTGTNSWGSNHFLVLRDMSLLQANPNDPNANLAFVSASGVMPGASTTVTFHFTAPSTPGPHTYRIQALENNVAWFATWVDETLTVGFGGADFNGDGRPDILWSNSSTGDRALWYMNGTTISGFDYLAWVPTAWRIVGTGHFRDSVGTTDLVWENTATGDRSIWLMNGTAITSFAYVAWVDPSWHIAAVGDFNGDGQPDLLWENAGSGGVDRAIWFLDGEAPASFGYLAGIPAEWRIVGAADFNADGQPDILWENVSTGQRSIWLMNGTGVAGFADLGTVAPAWHIAQVADFDGDGQPDLLWENQATGDRAIWIMHGTTHASSIYLAYVDPAWRISP